jgi:peroxiredoxin
LKFSITITLIINFLLIHLISCYQKEVKSLKPLQEANQIFYVNPLDITKNFKTWYSYNYNQIQLSQNFIGLDIDSTKITKDIFLHKLLQENIIAIKTKIENGQPTYKLFKLNTLNKSIISVKNENVNNEIAHFKMEGTKFPLFNFKDINGKYYNNDSLKGKITLIKCWFVHCTTCVQEFPQLNKLVSENISNKNIVFVSLANDSKEDLQKFLLTKPLSYSVIPEMRNFVFDSLKVNMFPTHFLINGAGKIVKVTNNIEEIMPFFNALK